ncbi:hypothetical protein OGAPHI_007135 [Ogataea philodendri]|uniref:FAR1 domain-containing protein n=1 Tax=Ogataea philodendri TaxID=1378263 RepID=A0A9P8NW64_9ASCO|nr:uncharacterized protein OGAPHI_007135 [Ogataea philodendri]KAH3660549.1 hypothetical protein OGAPHI_007135 [Ogataea philodendri]
MDYKVQSVQDMESGLTKGKQYSPTDENPSSEPLMLDKKFFDDKQSIKPWLHSQLEPRGINIVIERSDDTKIVFKCKNTHTFNTSTSFSTSKAQKNGSKESARKNKTLCPFRIRANYSLRAKKWSIVVVNDQHNHALYPATISRTDSDSKLGPGSRVQKPVFSAPSMNKRPNFGPTNSLLMAAQLQPVSAPKFQLPLPTNFGQMHQSPAHGGLVESLSSKSSSSSSSPQMSYSESDTSGAKDAKAGSATQQQQQRLSVLHIEINNLLLHLNTSASLSDANKEETYFRIISTLKDTLKQPNTHQFSPTSGTTTPSHPRSQTSLYNYTTNSEKVLLPSLTNSLQGTLQSIRSPNGVVGVNGTYNQYYI